MNLFNTIDSNPDSSGLVAVLLIVLVFSYLYMMDRKIKLIALLRMIAGKIPAFGYLIIVMGIITYVAILMNS